MKLEERCLNNLFALDSNSARLFANGCTHCKYDGRNKSCPYYIPLKTLTFEIKEIKYTNIIAA